ncbi:MAG: hypothetical protein HYX92_04780 [Chloroflexi bacterium]|nr:hypothetical protein [Chloroflexota bacterium]
MKKVTPELLAGCLAAIKSGQMSVEECVAAHPAQADELHQLLEIARAIPPVAPVAPDPAFRLRARVALIETISAEAGVTPSLLQRLCRQIGDWGQTMSPKRRMGMPALIAALVIALTSAAGGGAVYASQDALPTDALYSVKTAVEIVQLALAANDEAKAQTYVDLAAKRLEEIQRASQTANAGAVNTAADAFVQDVAGAQQHLEQAANSGRDVSRLAARLAENLARQQQKLAATAERAPEAARAALAKAAERAGKGLTLPGGRSAATPGARPAEVIETTATPTGGPAMGTPTPTAGAGGTPPTTPQPTGTARPTATALSPEAGVDRLASDVEKLASDPKISGQSYRGLLAKLEAAKAALERGQSRVALNNLDAFLNELNAFERSGHISAANYEALYASYSALVARLGGTPRARRGDGSTSPTPTATGSVTPAPTAEPERDRERGRGRDREDDRQAPPEPPGQEDRERGRDQDRDRDRGRDDSPRGRQADPNRPSGGPGRGR